MDLFFTRATGGRAWAYCSQECADTTKRCFSAHRGLTVHRARTRVTDTCQHCATCVSLIPTPVCAMHEVCPPTDWTASAAAPGIAAELRKRFGDNLPPACWDTLAATYCGQLAERGKFLRPAAVIEAVWLMRPSWAA